MSKSESRMKLFGTPEKLRQFNTLRFNDEPAVVYEYHLISELEDLLTESSIRPNCLWAWHEDSAGNVNFR